MQDLTEALCKAHPLATYGVMALLIASSLGWMVWSWKNRDLLGHFTNPLVRPLELETSDYFFVAIIISMLFSGVPVAIFDLLLVIGCLSLWKIRTHSGLTYLQLSAEEAPKLGLIAITVAFAIYLPLEVFSDLLGKGLAHLGWKSPDQPAVELFTHAQNLRDLIPLLLLATVAAPMGEEFLFRGLIYTSLKKTVNPWTATFISGFLFALLHVHLLSFLPLMALGMLLCRVLEITGSLWTGVLIHATFNAITAVWLVLARISAHAPS